MDTIEKDGYKLIEVSDYRKDYLLISLSWYYTDILHSFNLFDFDKSIYDIDPSNISHVFIKQDCEIERYKELIYIYEQLSEYFNDNCAVEYVRSDENVFNFQLSKISLKCYLDDYEDYDFSNKYQSGKTTGFTTID